MFTVVRSVLLKPLPFKDPARLVRLYEQSVDDKFPYNNVASGVFAAWKKESQSFSDLAILSEGPRYNLSGAFAGLSLVLAALGLFGVLSYIVAQRTTEM